MYLTISKFPAYIGTIVALHNLNHLRLLVIINIVWLDELEFFTQIEIEQSEL